MPTPAQTRPVNEHILKLKEQLNDQVDAAIAIIISAEESGQLLPSHKRRITSSVRLTSSTPSNLPPISPLPSETNPSNPSNPPKFDIMEEVSASLNLVRRLRQQVFQADSEGNPMSPREVRDVLSSTNSLFTTLMKYRTELQNEETGAAHAQAIELALKDFPQKYQDQFFARLSELLGG